MLFVAILVGILSSAILGLLVALISMMTDHNLLGFTVMYIFPIGTILFSMVVSVFYFITLVKGNVKVTFAKSLVMVVIVFISYFGIEYFTYLNTYIDVDGDGLNYSREGYHISEFYNENTDETFTFLSYYKYRVDHAIVTSYSKYSDSSTTVEGKTGLNWVREIAAILGLPIGVAFAYASVFEDRKYCEECKKYMKKKKLFAILDNFAEAINSLDEIINSEDISSVESLRTFIESNPTSLRYSNSHIIGKAYYCKGCNKTHLVLTPYVVGGKGFKADNSNAKTYTLDKNFYSIIANTK